MFVYDKNKDTPFCIGSIDLVFIIASVLQVHVGWMEIPTVHATHQQHEQDGKVHEAQG